MLYSLILVIHIIVCFVLIAVILLQAGRGGGLSDAVSGSAQSMFGTRGAAYLTRATTACAVVFMLTSLGLALLSAKEGHSLLAGARIAPVKAAPIPEAPATPAAPAAEAPAAPAPTVESAPAPAAEHPASESKPSE